MRASIFPLFEIGITAPKICFNQRIMCKKFITPPVPLLQSTTDIQKTHSDRSLPLFQLPSSIPSHRHLLRIGQKESTHPSGKFASGPRKGLSERSKGTMPSFHEGCVDSFSPLLSRNLCPQNEKAPDLSIQGLSKTHH